MNLFVIIENQRTDPLISNGSVRYSSTSF